MPSNKRRVNTVFQDYALFPHLNVFENVAFGLRIKKIPEADIERKVKEALRFVNLEGYEQRAIHEMSGDNGSASPSLAPSSTNRTYCC